jgi:hypothetical protein
VLDHLAVAPGREPEQPEEHRAEDPCRARQGQAGLVDGLEGSWWRPAQYARPARRPSANRCARRA